jgi:ceramide glucosyltransferase
MISDFYPGLFVARELEGVRFALGPSIATTRTHLNQFGGYDKIKNQPADDLLVGRLIAENGYEVELSAYTIQTVADYQSLREFVHKRMRWLIVMRHMRPKGHFGLLFTQALPWLLVALAARPAWTTALGLFGTYLGFRLATVWLVGIRGLRRPLWRFMPLVVVWDSVAFCLWVASFARNTVRWRGGDYYIRDGNLIPSTTR